MHLRWSGAQNAAPRGVDLFDVERLWLTEADEPPLPPRDAAARDQVWDMAVRANAALFDGPAVACGEWSGLARASCASPGCV